MQITWTNCAEQMPPDEQTKIIINDGNNYYIFEGYMIHIGWMKAVAINHKWTEYTPEKWKELNKGNDN